jgi:hypothetical protein
MLQTIEEHYWKLKQCFWDLKSRYRAWNYKRKYGINIEEGLLPFGREVLLTPAKENNDPNNPPRKQQNNAKARKKKKKRINNRS